ncbi:MAG: sugar ABC transporter permease [Anaeroplasmataceae bacterium]|nr:sugar ABC transporter permease [Anaeroplasmataceae bacterium]
MKKIKSFFKSIQARIKNLPKQLSFKFKGAKEIVTQGNGKVSASMVVMGLGQLMYKQWAKGLMFLFIQVAFIAYLVLVGASDLFGFFTLGQQESNAWYGIEGDNSVVMLIMGILSILIIILYIVMYIANIKDVYHTQCAVDTLKKPVGFKQELGALLDKSFHKTALALPVVGVCVFSILPIIFMILIAFTNYGGDIVPPALVDWVGLENFKRILSLGQFAPTFFKIFGWNMLWAVLATAINYFAGLGLALLLNKKCVKGKVIWRAFPILAYAIPGFITLLGFKFMFSYGGPINYYITQGGGEGIGFLGLDAKWTARFIGLAVNAWISIPSTMLLATGILSNINTDLYEAARVDGASAWKQFIKITLPYVLFATTPVLISQFIGNFNNFGIFYFLRGGLYVDGYFLASDTDLLINWLYNMSIDNNYYSIGAAISLVIFIITSVISLTVYVLSPSYKQEETFR